ncbi:MAG: hypothetical protein FWF15_06780, partial [Oscillospiraceae bacterium]|nr:hypothetical protein [Oscillospiraceae bacterium]
MYNQEYLNIIEKRNEFEVFTYKDSLRFNILFNDSPSSEIVDRFIIEIKHYMNEIKKGTILLWYSQVNGFSNELIDKLENHDEPYHFYKFQIEKDNINPNVDLKGLEKR